MKTKPQQYRLYELYEGDYSSTYPLTEIAQLIAPYIEEQPIELIEAEGLLNIKDSAFYLQPVEPK
jgi:hypothetical protein